MGNLSDLAIAAPNTYAKLKVFAARINMPRMSALINGSSTKTAEVVVEKKAEAPIKLEEAVYTHVIGKLPKDTTPEDTLKVFEGVNIGISKLAEAVTDHNSKEFVEAVIAAIDNGKIFEIESK